MAALQASTSQANPFPKKGKGPTLNRSPTAPPKPKVARNNGATRRGNLLTNAEQFQEPPGLPNHPITFVQEAPKPTTKKSPTASSSRPRGSYNRRANNTPINIIKQHPPTTLSNHTITFELDAVPISSHQPAKPVPAQVAEAETATGRRKEGQGTRRNFPEKSPLDHGAQFELVVEAALTVTEIFRKAGISCAVFGSLASKLYGCARTPKDVDMLVSQNCIEVNSSDSDSPSTSGQSHNLDAEGLKDLILLANSRNFYLKMPRNPEATYRVLWYRRSPQGPDCKVDLLVPGTMHLPYLPSERVVWKQNVPLVPFSLLLLQKLQGWDDHRKAVETRYKCKHPQDAADVKRLLGQAEPMNVLKRSFCLDDKELFTPEFQELTIERVRAYCEVYQDRAERWKMIGFPII